MNQFILNGTILKKYPIENNRIKLLVRPIGEKFDNKIYVVAFGKAADSINKNFAEKTRVGIIGNVQSYVVKDENEKESLKQNLVIERIEYLEPNALHLRSPEQEQLSKGE